MQPHTRTFSHIWRKSINAEEHEDVQRVQLTGVTAVVCGGAAGKLLGHRNESSSSDKRHKQTQDVNHVTRVAQHRSHRRYFGASWRRHHEPPPQFPESGVCQRGAAARFALGSGVETPARRDFKPLLRDRSVLRDPPLRRARHCAPPLSIVLAKLPPRYQIVLLAPRVPH